MSAATIGVVVNSDEHGNVTVNVGGVEYVPKQSENWTANQAVGISELLETLEIEDEFLENEPVWRALLANYVEARSKTPEHAKEIREICEMAKVEPAASWTDADYKTAQEAFDQLPTGEHEALAGSDWFSRARYPRIVAALDAVAHRLQAPAKTYEQGRQEAWDEIFRAAKAHGHVEHEETGEELRFADDSINEAQSTLDRIGLLTAERLISGDLVAVEKLSEEERTAFKHVFLSADRDDELQSCFYNVAHAAFNARFPKPTPKPRTVEELREVLFHQLPIAKGIVNQKACDALDELVALAQKATP